MKSAWMIFWMNQPGAFTSSITPTAIWTSLPHFQALSFPGKSASGWTWKRKTSGLKGKVVKSLWLSLMSLIVADWFSTSATPEALAPQQFKRCCRRCRRYFELLNIKIGKKKNFFFLLIYKRVFSICATRPENQCKALRCNGLRPKNCKLHLRKHQRHLRQK